MSEIQHDDRGFEPCRKCLHWHHIVGRIIGTTYQAQFPYCALNHDLYEPCEDFCEMKPARFRND